LHFLLGKGFLKSYFFPAFKRRLQGFDLKWLSFNKFISLSLFFWAAFSPVLGMINYGTSKYCPGDPPTVFTVTEQTTTYYLGTSNATALGACGVNWNMFDQNHYAAIDPGSWENGAACGSCAVLNYNGHSTTVMIVDECGTCGSNSNHLDLSPAAYGELVNSPGCASIAGSDRSIPAVVRWPQPRAK
jgi:hypothetical protein